MALLLHNAFSVKIHPVPVELKGSIPFAEDTQHAAYDPESAHRFWRILVQSGGWAATMTIEFILKRRYPNIRRGQITGSIELDAEQAARPSVKQLIDKQEDLKADLEDKLRHGWFVHGDIGGATPMMLVPPSMTQTESVPSVDPLIVEQIHAEGKLQPTALRGENIRYRWASLNAASA